MKALFSVMVAVCDAPGADALLAGIPDAVAVGRIIPRTGSAQTAFVGS